MSLMQLCRFVWREILLLFAIVALFVLVSMLLIERVWGMEGPSKLVKRGAYLYNTSKPACSSCHTEKRNSLADYGSRGSVEEAKDWLRTPNRQFEKAGKKGLMPAYKMPDEDVEALARYLMTLEE